MTIKLLATQNFLFLWKDKEYIFPVSEELIAKSRCISPPHIKASKESSPLKSSLSNLFTSWTNHGGLNPKFNFGSLLQVPKNFINRFQMLALCGLGNETLKAER